MGYIDDRLKSKDLCNALRDCPPAGTFRTMHSGKEIKFVEVKEIEGDASVCVFVYPDNDKQPSKFLITDGEGCGVDECVMLTGWDGNLMREDCLNRMPFGTAGNPLTYEEGNILALRDESTHDTRLFMLIRWKSEYGEQTGYDDIAEGEMVLITQEERSLLDCIPLRTYAAGDKLAYASPEEAEHFMKAIAPRIDLNLEAVRNGLLLQCSFSGYEKNLSQYENQITVKRLMRMSDYMWKGGELVLRENVVSPTDDEFNIELSEPEEQRHRFSPGQMIRRKDMSDFIMNDHYITDVIPSGYIIEGKFLILFDEEDEYEPADPVNGFATIDYYYDYIGAEPVGIRAFKQGDIIQDDNLHLYQIITNTDEYYITSDTTWIAIADQDKYELIYRPGEEHAMDMPHHDEAADDSDGQPQQEPSEPAVQVEPEPDDEAGPEDEWGWFEPDGGTDKGYPEEDFDPADPESDLCYDSLIRDVESEVDYWLNDDLDETDSADAQEDDESSTELPFSAVGSELIYNEWTIPEGYTAEVKDGKVIVRQVADSSPSDNEVADSCLSGKDAALSEDRIQVNQFVEYPFVYIGNGDAGGLSVVVDAAVVPNKGFRLQLMPIDEKAGTFDYEYLGEIACRPASELTTKDAPWFTYAEMQDMFCPGRSVHCWPGSKYDINPRKNDRVLVADIIGEWHLKFYDHAEREILDANNYDDSEPLTGNKYVMTDGTAWRYMVPYTPSLNGWLNNGND